MPKQEETEDSWETTLDNICLELNVDLHAKKRAKESFREIKENFTLDGDVQHWLACALYVACRSTITPTVQSGTAVEGNCVSLTRLLRKCNISLIQFFNKIKNWMEMASMSDEFKQRITQLERKFAVSTVLFDKFQPIFQEIFLGLTNEPVKTNSIKSKKYRMQPCTTNALFEFTWALYICVKGEFHRSADDLVDMFHVLLSCLDCVFANAFMARRIDLINPEFKGLPKDWLNDDFQVTKPPCFINSLCDIKGGLKLEAGTMKEYSWRPVIKSFFEKGILKGDAEMLTGLLDVGNFDANLKSVNNNYETYVLSVGEFDERIFLGERAYEQVGSRKSANSEISQVIASFGPSTRACPDTPLTGRRYLSSRAEPLTPVSEATNSLNRLTTYLKQTKPQPSSHLMRMFADCGVSEETINSKVLVPCKGWQEQFASSLREANCCPETVKRRANMVACLYYKVFEHIIREEHRKKPQVSLQVLVSQETYQRAVFVCCAMVVLHAYGAHSLRFPRLLALYRLSAFHFYKVIELVVQALFNNLSRDVIKHLNTVEEEVLESLVWTSDSPLWEELKDTAVPASTEVYVSESPHSRRNAGGLQSPVSAAIDRYMMPMADQAKKQLFKDNIRPGQSLLVQPNGESAAPQPSTSNGESSTAPPAPAPAPKNSVILFFRKFYSLAVVRMNDLCARLRLTDDELKRKMWTCLEHSIMHQTRLMKDRHLDQILMCAVYVICKVSHNANNPVDRTFAEIMKQYRQRPLADNHVYRSVLIQQGSGESSPVKGDLIHFYNKVYVKCMQSFALQFTGKHKDECCLSPLPAGRGDAAVSPCGQRVSERHQLYVKPLTTPPPHNKHLTYRFSRSPAKDLHAINTMVSCEVGGGALKRAGELAAVTVTSGEGGPATVKRARLAPPAGVARKLHGLMTDRQAV